LKEDSGLHDLKIRQLIERYRNRTFRWLTWELQRTGDVDFIRRGVTWTYQYTNSWLPEEYPEFPETNEDYEGLD
jgi:hypothetical protein